ncbi:hypothetical protein MZM54_00085 [[Brevibacterium] frigoritolerans]|nr:hypothetical protein [Peribacillus frigoritolerans]
MIEMFVRKNEWRLSLANRLKNVCIYKQEYKTIREMSETYNIPFYALEGRIRKGMSVEDAIKEGVNKNEVIVFGKTYISLIEALKHFDVSYERVKHLLMKHYGLEDAIIHCLTSNIVYNGKTYTKLVDLCSDYGKDSETISTRLRSGWTLYEALNKEKKEPTKSKTVEYRGKLYKSQKELANSYGLHTDMVKAFVRRHKVDYVTAFDIINTFLEPYRGNRPTIISKIPYVIYNGEWLKSSDVLCEICGVTKLNLMPFMTKHKIKNPFDALQKMKDSTVERHILKETGKFYSVADLQYNLKENIDILIRKGIVERRKINVYPDCTYNPIGYCATVFQDYKQYLSKLDVIKTKEKSVSN